MSKTLGEIVQQLVEDIAQANGIPDFMNPEKQEVGPGSFVRVESAADKRSFVAHLRSELEPGIWLADIYPLGSKQRDGVAKVTKDQVMEVLDPEVLAASRLEPKPLKPGASKRPKARQGVIGAAIIPGAMPINMLPPFCRDDATDALSYAMHGALLPRESDDAKHHILEQGGTGVARTALPGDIVAVLWREKKCRIAVVVTRQRGPFYWGDIVSEAPDGAKRGDRVAFTRSAVQEFLQLAPRPAEQANQTQVAREAAKATNVPPSPGRGFLSGILGLDPARGIQ